MTRTSIDDLSPKHTQESMIEHMIKEAHNRHFKNEHKPIDSWPNLSTLGESVLLGSFSWLGLSSGTRWVKRSTSINVGPYLSTPSDIARDYIREKYQTRRRVTTGQYAYISRLSPHPLYAVPQTIPDAVYIDIKAAYWSIISTVGWDVDYFPCKWLARGERMDDFPYAGHKLARNCLFSFGLPGTSNIYSAEKKTIVSVRKHNQYTNMMLRSLVMDVLHGVANDAITVGAQYVHTDGYIISARHADRLRIAIAEWGLVGSIRFEGDATIHAAGTYDIGDHEHRNSVYRPQAFNNVRTFEHVRWLRDKFRGWAIR